MTLILSALRDAWNWIQQGGNSNIVLVAITAIYSFLTHRIMKATSLQAKAALQPSLEICRLKKNDDDARYVYVKNRSHNPVIILDVTIIARPMEGAAIVRQLTQYDDQVVSQTIDFSYSLPSSMGLNDDSYGVEVLLTVCDMSRQIVVEYSFYPVTGNIHCYERYRVGVRFRRGIRPLRWRYFQMKHWYERERSRMVEEIAASSRVFINACGKMLKRW